MFPAAGDIASPQRSGQLFLQRRAGQYGTPSLASDKTAIFMENATFKRRLALRLGYPAGRHRLAGKNIGNANAGIIRETATYHETGLHAGITMRGRLTAATGVSASLKKILRAA